MQNLKNKLVMGLQIKETMPKPDIEAFIDVLFEYRTYGIVIPTYPVQLEADWGDWIVRFPDGTYGVIAQEVWDKYITGKCNKVPK